LVISEQYYYFLFSKHFPNSEAFDLTVEAIVDEETEYTGRYRVTLKSQQTQEISIKEFQCNIDGDWFEKGNANNLLAEMIGKEIDDYIE
jgi:hypothetical protein